MRAVSVADFKEAAGLAVERGVAQVKPSRPQKGGADGWRRNLLKTMICPAPLSALGV